MDFFETLLGNFSDIELEEKEEEVDEEALWASAKISTRKESICAIAGASFQFPVSLSLAASAVELDNSW